MRLGMSASLLLALSVAAFTTGCDDEDPGEPRPLEIHLSAEPDPTGRTDGIVDFGRVLLGRQKNIAVSVSSGEEEAAMVKVVGLQAPFGITYPVNELELWPFGRLGFPFTFKPSGEGPVALEVAIEVQLGRRTKRFTLLLVGIGAEPLLECEPGPLEFGRVQTYSSRTLTWRCTNRSQMTLPVVVGASSETGGNQFDAVIRLRSGDVVRGIDVRHGDALEVAVTYEPRQVGPVQSTLALQVNGARVGQVELIAEGVEESLILEQDGCLDFGNVPFGGTGSRTLTLMNTRDYTRSLETQLEGGLDGEFAFEPWPVVIEPFESRPLTVRFQPKAPGERAATLRVGSPWSPLIEVCVRGVGHGNRLTCDERVDFPDEVIAGLTRTARFVCRNDGFFHDDEEARPLHVNRVRSTGPAFRATPNPGIRFGGYAIGDELEVEVSFTPAAGGLHEGEVTVHAEGVPGGLVAVPVSGRARELPPCSAQIEPSFLDFGIVSPGRTATAYVGVRNQLSSGSCWASMFLSFDSDPAFRLGPGPARALDPGESMVLPIHFTAPAARHYARGRLLVEISDPSDPIREVVIEGQSGTPCLTFEPEAIEFPSVPRSCATPVRSVTVRACPGATIQSIDLAAGLDADAFVVSRRPELPTTPGDGEAISFDVWFSSQRWGTIHGAVDVQYGQGSHRLPLSGSVDEIQTDRYVVDDPVAPLPLSVPPTDNNGDGIVDDKDMEVRVDGWKTHPVDAFGQQVWSFDPDAQAIRFEATSAPRAGAEVRITFKPTCLSSPAVPD